MGPLSCGGRLAGLANRTRLSQPNGTSCAAQGSSPIRLPSAKIVNEHKPVARPIHGAEQHHRSSGETLVSLALSLEPSPWLNRMRCETQRADWRRTRHPRRGKRHAPSAKLLSNIELHNAAFRFTSTGAFSIAADLRSAAGVLLYSGECRSKEKANADCCSGNSCRAWNFVLLRA